MAKTYLITGASSDVGIALIDRLLAEGAPEDKVIAQGFGDLSGLAPLALKYKGRMHTFDTDLSNAEATMLFLNAAQSVCGCPTHIVHLPALRAINTKFKNFDEARFSADLQVQLGTAITICKQFLPQMAKQKYGRVLFMLTSYILGVPPKNMSAYVVVKQALHGLSQSLAAEYAPHGITVNCVAPSMMETKFLADTPNLIVQASAEANPMGRNATPADVVPAMAFLLGDEAGFITGTVLPITGGSSV